MSSRLAERRGIAVIAVTRRGTRLGAGIAATLGPDATLHVTQRWADEAPAGALVFEGAAAAHVARLFPTSRALVLVLAVGASVRLIAPLLGRKQDDPAVIAVDETGHYVVPVAGGHQAGANNLSRQIASAIGGEAVITTASDTLGLPALDTLGREEGWKVEATPESLKRVMATVVDGARVAIFQGAGSSRPLADIPDDWPRLGSLDEFSTWDGPTLGISDCAIDGEAVEQATDRIVYRPPTLVIGVGCSLGAPAGEVAALARDALTSAGLAVGSVGMVATIDRRLTEPAIVALAERLGAGLVGYSAEALAAVPNLPTPSTEVARHVGTPGVCEPAALLASDGGRLIVTKQKSAHATVAIARRGDAARDRGRLTLVGLGPGALDLLTPRARRALDVADLVIGYRAYLDSIASLAPAKRLRPYEIGQERERAQDAIRLAQEGRRVALVSSGDIGVYGMAGLVFELLAEGPADPSQGNVDVEVVPGITAASAAGSLLGAPLMLDFAAISLSDLLVPWDSIERRLTAAAEADLTVVLYNPASGRRRAGLARAVEILRQHRPPTTPAGLVREAYRPEQDVIVTTLGDLPLDRIDMKTVVVVGCSRTTVLDGRLVTRRGYDPKDRRDERATG